MNRLTLIMALFIGNSSISTWCQETDPRVLQAQEDMKKIGFAIEKMYQEKGVLPVDLMDDDTPEGLARIQTVFEGVGMPVNGVRTMKDVLQPLVHFGYLTEIPVDPYIPAGADPVWNTYAYTDEEQAIPGVDANIPFIPLEKHAYMNPVFPSQAWILASPGADGTLKRPWEDITLDRHAIYMQSPLVEDVIARQREAFRIVGQAIEKFRQDKGILPVDLWDANTPIGQNQLKTVLQGIGDVPFAERNNKDVFEPLIRFGYLNEIPLDPVKTPFPVDRTQISDERLPVYYFLYIDNDVENDSPDEFPNSPASAWITNGLLQEGEWVLVGTKAQTDIFWGMYSPLNTEIYEDSPIMTKKMLSSSVPYWETYCAD